MYGCNVDRVLQEWTDYDHEMVYSGAERDMCVIPTGYSVVLYLLRGLFLMPLYSGTEARGPEGRAFRRHSRHKLSFSRWTDGPPPGRQ